jgi:hypothetical protein
MPLEHPLEGRGGLKCAECGEGFTVEEELAAHTRIPHPTLRRL